MKRRYIIQTILVIAFSIGLHSGLNAQWSPVHFGNNLTCLAVVNNDVVLAAGNNVIIKSTDGGTTWSSVLPEGLSFNALDMEIAGNCIYAFSENAVIKTTDQGNNWTTVFTSSDDRIKRFSFSGNSTGMVYVEGDQNKLMLTKDGGLSWSAVPFNFISGGTISGIEITDDATCYIIEHSEGDGNGDLLVKSADTGLIWNYLPGFHGIVVPGSPIAFTTSEKGYIFAPFAIYATEDGGENWTQLPDQRNYFVFSEAWIYPLSTGSLYFCGSEVLSWYTDIFFTNNNGNLWQQQGMHGYGAMKDIQMADDSTGYVLAAGFYNSESVVFKTIHGGFVWANTFATNKSAADQYIITPNPLNDAMFVHPLNSNSIENTTLNMYELTGKKVLSVNIKTDMPVDVSSFPSGIYFYSILKNGIVVQSGKLIKQ
jgi:photosystem II stability/assembly factor-like uncharacterized protein